MVLDVPESGWRVADSKPARIQVQAQAVQLLEREMGSSDRIRHRVDDSKETH